MEVEKGVSPPGCSGIISGSHLIGPTGITYPSLSPDLCLEECVCQSARLGPHTVARELQMDPSQATWSEHGGGVASQRRSRVLFVGEWSVAEQTVQSEQTLSPECGQGAQWDPGPCWLSPSLQWGRVSRAARRLAPRLNRGESARVDLDIATEMNLIRPK